MKSTQGGKQVRQGGSDLLDGGSAIGFSTTAAVAKEVAQPREGMVTIQRGPALIREILGRAGSRQRRLSCPSQRPAPAETVHLASDAAFNLLGRTLTRSGSVDKPRSSSAASWCWSTTKATEMLVTLLSTSGGRVVRDGDGRILVDPPGRVVLPPGSADELLLRPTLSWQLWSDAAGNHDAEITYLSGGLSWQADYVVLLNADDTAATSRLVIVRLQGTSITTPPGGGDGTSCAINRRPPRCWR
jgi:hypothetical protein